MQVQVDQDVLGTSYKAATLPPQPVSSPNNVKASSNATQTKATTAAAGTNVISIPLPKPKDAQHSEDATARSKSRKAKPSHDAHDDQAKSAKADDIVNDEKRTKKVAGEEDSKKKKKAKKVEDKKDDKHAKESPNSEKNDSSRDKGESGRKGDEKDKKRKDRRERGKKKDSLDAGASGPSMQELVDELKTRGFKDTDTVRLTCLLGENSMNIEAVTTLLSAERDAAERAAKLQSVLSHLDSLGFCDTAKNTKLLEQCNMDPDQVIATITAEREAYRASLMVAEAKLKVPAVQLGVTSRKGQGHPTNEDRECHVDLREQLSQETLIRLGGTDGMWLWGVFDGHGGPAISDYTSNHLVENLVKELEDGESTIPAALVEAYAKTEEQILTLERETGEDSGTCAVSVVLCGTELHIAHVGDCRAIVASGITPSGDIAPKLTSKELTHDHRGIYPGEKERIADAGGKIVDGRVNGGLIPSRTFGDLSHKQKCPGAVIAEPTVSKYEMQRADQYFVLASDGLWDDMTSDRAVGIVRKATKAQPAAEALAREVGKKYGGKHLDDFTVLVIRLLHGK